METGEYSEPIIPASNIFDLLSKSPRREDTAQLPTVAECAVHLEFLMALHVLRRSVTHSTALDEVFDMRLDPDHQQRRSRLSFRQAKRNRAAEVEMQSKKWIIFVEFAAERFIRWLKTADALIGGSHAAFAKPELLLPSLGQSGTTTKKDILGN